MKKRILGGLAAAAMLTGGLAFSSAGVVSAHHPEIEAAATCQANGSYSVDWTSTSWATGAQGQNPAILVSWTGAATGSYTGAYTASSYSFNGSFQVPGTTSGTITFTAKPTAPWGNGNTSKDSRSASVKLKGDCPQPPTPITPQPPTVTPPTCDAPGSVSVPTDTVGYSWVKQQDGTYVAVAKPGYVFAEGSVTTFDPGDLGKLSPNDERCRPPQPPAEVTREHSCEAPGTVNVTTTPYVWDNEKSAWVPGTPVESTEPATEDQIESCMPEPEVAETEWQDGTFECGATSVTQTRTVTTTPFVWNGEEFVLDTENATSVTETQTRALTADEIEPCPTQPPTTQPPTTQPPTTQPPTTQPPTTSIVEVLPPVETPSTTDVAAAGPTVPAAGGLPVTGSEGTGTTALIALLAISLGGLALVVARRRNVTG